MVSRSSDLIASCKESHILLAVPTVLNKCFFPKSGNKGNNVVELKAKVTFKRIWSQLWCTKSKCAKQML